jgi:hypothetical protein
VASAAHVPLHRHRSRSAHSGTLFACCIVDTTAEGEIIMEPVPYEIREEDIDEVLSAYEPVGGGEWSDEDRTDIRAHVMRSILDIDDIVRSVPEDGPQDATADATRAGSLSERPGDESAARREMALAAIEDLLIRDGYIDLAPDESRVFPAGVEDEPGT